MAFTLRLTECKFFVIAQSILATTGYGLNVRGVGVRVPVGSRIFSLHSPDRLWGPPSLLSNVYWDCFLGDKPTGA
jgi:hypothetical protein